MTLGKRNALFESVKTRITETLAKHEVKPPKFYSPEEWKDHGHGVYSRSFVCAIVYKYSSEDGRFFDYSHAESCRSYDDLEEMIEALKPLGVFSESINAEVSGIYLIND